MNVIHLLSEDYDKGMQAVMEAKDRHYMLGRLINALAHPPSRIACASALMTLKETLDETHLSPLLEMEREGVIGWIIGVQCVKIGHVAAVAERLIQYARNQNLSHLCHVTLCHLVKVYGYQYLESPTNADMLLVTLTMAQTFPKTPLPLPHTRCFWHIDNVEIVKTCFHAAQSNTHPILHSIFIACLQNVGEDENAKALFWDCIESVLFSTEASLEKNYAGCRFLEQALQSKLAIEWMPGMLRLLDQSTSKQRQMILNNAIQRVMELIQQDSSVSLKVMEKCPSNSHLLTVLLKSTKPDMLIEKMMKDDDLDKLMRMIPHTTCSVAVYSNLLKWMAQKEETCRKQMIKLLSHLYATQPSVSWMSVFYSKADLAQHVDVSLDQFVDGVRADAEVSEEMKRTSELVLFLHFMLSKQLLTENQDEYQEMLKDLIKCQQSKEYNVLFDILFGLLNLEWKVVGCLVGRVFEVVSEKMDQESIRALLEIIDPLSAYDHKESDEDEEETEASEEEENDQSESDSESDSGCEDESDTEKPEQDSEFYAKIQAAFQTEAVDEDDLLTDEQMISMGFDAKLSEIFALRKQQQQNKNGLVMRILDMIEKGSGFDVDLVVGLIQGAMIMSNSDGASMALRQQASQNVYLAGRLGMISELKEEERTQGVRKMSLVAKAIITKKGGVCCADKDKLRNAINAMIGVILGEMDKQVGVGDRSAGKYLPLVFSGAGKLVIEAAGDVLSGLCKLTLPLLTSEEQIIFYQEICAVFNHFVQRHVNKNIKKGVPIVVFLSMMRKNVFAGMGKHSVQVMHEVIGKPVTEILTKEPRRHAMFQLWHLMDQMVKSMDLSAESGLEDPLRRANFWLQTVVPELVEVFIKSMKSEMGPDVKVQRIKEVCSVFNGIVRKTRKLLMDRGDVEETVQQTMAKLFMPHILGEVLHKVVAGMDGKPALKQLVQQVLSKLGVQVAMAGDSKSNKRSASEDLPIKVEKQQKTQ